MEAALRGDEEDRAEGERKSSEVSGKTGRLGFAGERNAGLRKALGVEDSLGDPEGGKQLPEDQTVWLGGRWARREPER